MLQCGSGCLTMQIADLILADGQSGATLKDFDSPPAVDSTPSRSGPMVVGNKHSALRRIERKFKS